MNQRCKRDGEEEERRRHGENERKFIGQSMAGSVEYIYLRGARD